MDELTKNTRSFLHVIEQSILKFFTEISDEVGLDSNTMKIYAYLQIYEPLTQEQLKFLTKFSISTVSTNLSKLTELHTISRSLIPNSHKYQYHIIFPKIEFEYRDMRSILISIESLEHFIIGMQEEAYQFVQDYPIEVTFLNTKLNSVRNYAEIQRRVISNQTRNPFFPEFPTEGHQLILTQGYPPPLKKIEEKITNFFVTQRIFTANNPISNTIYALFLTRESLSQDQFYKLSHFSLSSLSRILRQMVKSRIVTTTPRRYHTPQIYRLKSMSLCLLNIILKTDKRIFSWESPFRKYRDDLEKISNSRVVSQQHQQISDFLNNLLNRIEEFKVGSHHLEKELKVFEEFFSRSEMSEKK